MHAVLAACRRDPLLTIANTPLVLSITLVATWLLTGGSFSLLEHKSLEDGLYWSVTTMSTTGYGDLSPHTDAGKVLAGLLMVWSIFFLLPAAIYHVAERLIQDKDEWSHEEQEQLRKDVADIKTMVSHVASSEIVNK